MTTDNMPSTAKGWLRILARYREPSTRRSLFEIAVTLLPFTALWAGMWACLQVSYLLTLAMSVPAAFLLLRLFLIQHDCGHDSFFHRRAANDWVGRALGILTLTPYDHWRKSHAIHHASVGNLDQRGIGDVTTMTVAEYRDASRWARLGYRLYRHPAVMFGLGPAYLFILKHRLPFGTAGRGWRPWVGVMSTNVATALVVAGLAWWIGIVPFLMIHLPVVLVSSTVGVHLFYVQHQYDGTTWSSEPEWSHAEAALHGSSHYDLPGPLRWLTANIGMHHVHHLGSRVPYYRLPEVLRDYPGLRDIGRITLGQGLRSIPLVLWDEAGRRLVSFRTARECA